MFLLKKKCVNHCYFFPWLLGRRPLSSHLPHSAWRWGQHGQWWRVSWTTIRRAPSRRHQQSVAPPDDPAPGSPCVARWGAPAHLRRGPADASRCHSQGRLGGSPSSQTHHKRRGPCSDLQLGQNFQLLLMVLLRSSQYLMLRTISQSKQNSIKNQITMKINVTLTPPPLWIISLNLKVILIFTIWAKFPSMEAHGCDNCAGCLLCTVRAPLSSWLYRCMLTSHRWSCLLISLLLTPRLLSSHHRPQLLWFVKPW